MSMERLSDQVDSYVAWKRELVREITRYRGWLERNRLNSSTLDTRLERSLRLLRTDHITLAFVGEFSRGKSELINSLFFSSYGQRLLPSTAGRTTMCPTELFYDPAAQTSYIRLLPIETRMASTSLVQFKRVPHYWVNIPLLPDDPESMAHAFAQVARTKPMPLEKAIALGFQPDMLESAGQPGMVLVPAWRHALINLDHPLLRQGLRILDTPGLNALGSEPELTLSMLPSAQAIIYLLAADSGVTASDMAIWQQHIRQLDQDTQQNLFAVLNKIDVLWDDLAGERFVQDAIQRMHESTARQLGLAVEAVLPLSAKQGMLAKVRNDSQLLARSQLGGLEQLLCERIVAGKEEMLQSRVVNQLLSMLRSSQQLLSQRLDKVREQQQQLAAHQQDNGQMLQELTAKTKDDHGLHHKRLLSLKSSQRLLARQGDLLRAATRSQRFELHVEEVRNSLRDSWTSIGNKRAIQHFFEAVAADLESLGDEADTANQLVEAVYARHNSENPLNGMEAPLFNVSHYQRELRQLQEQTNQFRLQLKTLLTDQASLGQRFFDTLVQEVIALHERVRSDAEQWASDALMPLLQHAMEHKQLLEIHLLRLRALAQETQLTQKRSQQMEQYASELQLQLTEASDILRIMRRPAPIQRKAKVVSLPVTARQRDAGESA
ncbi:dynamin-like GTPase family protein [Pseudomonas sp. N040]|uniref:dynamin-like GTPase family protein n=1 Tax=Pseudomonas sp. N040 TaxID=2785325 RepID=UPI0018A28E4D|nr:dynamin-like GTPase family protein [Pseudomonas sp. N040]MBF7729939.1 dynamin-like GTPase family protein [Pseudomonas sp. N040]MBW7013581.1 dynamin-like GTPase family protein [Pseudomonas sp. N040]